MTSASTNRRIVACIWRWVSLNVKSIWQGSPRLADRMGILWTMITTKALCLAPVSGKEVHLLSGGGFDETASEAPHRRASYGGIAAYTAISICSPATRTAYDVTPTAAGGRLTAPVLRSKIAPCQGQIAVSPSTSPSESGPPRCGHVSS